MRLQLSTSLVAATIAAVVCLVVAAPPAGASDTRQPGNQLALGVTPAITEIVLEPGKQKAKLITVTNVTNEPVPVKGTIASMMPYETVKEADRKIFDASSWLHLSETEFILQPKQQKQITITASAPEKAAPGGHYATVFFQPAVASESTASNAAYIGSKVGVLAFMIVKGDIKEQLAITSFSGGGFIRQKGPVTLSLSLQNSGNVHLLPVGSIEIFDFFGKKLDTLPLPAAITLPKTTKTITLEWDNKGYLGFFTARAGIKYGTRNIELVERIGVLIAPWLWAAILALVGGAAGFVLWRWRGRWRRAIKVLIFK